MRLTATTFVTMDGVIQGPGAPDEDPSGEFGQGGWLVPYADDDMAEIIGARFAAATRSSLGGGLTSCGLPGRELQVHGSPQLVRSLLAYELIDEYQVLLYRSCWDTAGGSSTIPGSPPRSGLPARPQRAAALPCSPTCQPGSHGTGRLPLIPSQNGTGSSGDRVRHPPRCSDGEMSCSPRSSTLPRTRDPPDVTAIGATVRPCGSFGNGT